VSVSIESLDQLLAERKILICCGSGGVGKTTTSAAIALRAALRGRRAVVCTIDPARRLANSLGLAKGSADVQGDLIVEVDLGQVARAGESGGSLQALMLDTKRTFDDLIGRYARSDAARERILANSFYQQMSSTVVGSSDYMAMEKLYELHEAGTYDLIVLDTPPTKHALDFLQAPKRMTEAFDEGTLQVFLKPWADVSKKTFGFLGRAFNRVVKKVDNILGLKFVEDLADFFQAFEGMYEGFQGRAKRVDALLREPFTSFVVVTSPAPLPLQEASYFCDRLRELHMPLDALIVNRVHASSLAHPELRGGLQERLRREGPRAVLEAAEAKAGNGSGGEPPELLGHLLRAFLDHELLAAGDRARIERLRRDQGQGLFVAEVPSLSRDVYDLSGLEELVMHLFPSESA